MGPNIGEGLKHKIGPVPVWVIAVGVGGVTAYTIRRRAKNKASVTATVAEAGSPAASGTYNPIQAQGSGLAYAPADGFGSGSTGIVPEWATQLQAQIADLATVSNTPGLVYGPGLSLYDSGATPDAGLPIFTPSPPPVEQAPVAQEVPSPQAVSTFVPQPAAPTAPRPAANIGIGGFSGGNANSSSAASAGPRPGTIIWRGAAPGNRQTIQNGNPGVTFKLVQAGNGQYVAQVT